MIIRSYRPADEEALRALCRRAILVSGQWLYTREELDAWAGFTLDRATFREFLQGQRAVVADRDGRPVLREEEVLRRGVPLLRFSVAREEAST